MIIEDAFDPSQNLFDMSPVNPFLQMNLEQLNFRSVLLQGNQIYVEKFETSIKLIPGSTATHIPVSIYNYMEDNFFDYLCVAPNKDNNNA